MTTRQLVTLFMCALVVWIIGQALFALLPVYAARLGANSSEIGNYLASAFAFLTAGTMVAGRLLRKFNYPRLIIISVGLAEAVPAFLMSQATQFWQLVVLTLIIWFVGGIGISTITILAGMAANEAERGKVFGILGMAGGLGGVIGGALGGPIVDRWGYAALFIVSALGYLMQVVIALLITVRLPKQADQTGGIARKTESLGLAFYCLFVASVVISIPGFLAGLGRPLEMDRMKFDAAAITGVLSVGSAVSLPFPFILGWLSDRIGRYRLLALCMACTLIGCAILIVSVSLWHFWVSSALIAVGSSVGVVGQALVADLVPAEALSEGLAQFGATGWLGGVIGLMSAGYIIQGLGFQRAALVGTLFAALSLAFLFGTHRFSAQRATVSLAA